MHLLETIYTISVLVAISACIPQIRELWIKKAADEFSLPTWTAWTATQTVTLAYVIQLENTLLIVANICWVSFYGLMSAMIIYYNYQAKYRPVSDEATEPLAANAE